MISLKYDLECALRSALPGLRENIEDFELSCALDDDDIIQLLSDSLIKFVQARTPQKSPRALPRHEECLDCDALILLHRDGESHCEVCWEYWPCAEAGELNQEYLESLQKNYLNLARDPLSLTPEEYLELRDTRRRLEAEGQLPPTGEK